MRHKPPGGPASEFIGSCVGFGLHLVHGLAVGVLAGGYARLVASLRHDESLAGLVRDGGADAVLASDELGVEALRKSNKELVTAAEREAERRMADAVADRFPEHAIVGEEHGYRPGSAMRWVFDPVDGTSAMLRTAIAEAYALPLPEPVPSFGSTVALVDGDHAVVGIVVELRADGGVLTASNTWVGASGLATTCNGRVVVAPAAPARLGGAVLASTVPEVMFNTAEQWRRFQALRDATVRCVTDQNCVGFMSLLQGDGADRVDVVYEADLAYHDVAALVPVLHGAGLAVTDEHGRAPRFPEAAIGQEFRVLAAQPHLHAQALTRITSAIDTGGAPERAAFEQGPPVSRGYAQKFPDADPA